MLDSTSELEEQLRHMLDEMSLLIFDKDMSIIERFWAGGRFWLFGSENEHYVTREEHQLHLRTFLEKPYRARFRFAELSCDSHGDMAWVNSMGTLEIHHPDRVVERPYRLFALFQNIAGQWQWRVFSGSEPASALQ